MRLFLVFVLVSIMGCQDDTGDSSESDECYLGMCEEDTGGVDEGTVVDQETDMPSDSDTESERDTGPDTGSDTGSVVDTDTGVDTDSDTVPEYRVCAGDGCPFDTGMEFPAWGAKFFFAHLV